VPGPPAALPDAADRHLIVDDVDRSLFISAGAGSGKTSALVARIVGLVHRHEVPIQSIVAITFTEKAAAELRHRLRTELAKVGRATDELDDAPIGTLHAFARRLLAEYPTEVGLPPRFSVLDEVQSSIAFEQWFDGFVREVFDDLSSARLIHLCSFDNYRPVRDLRRLAMSFADNWDLVAERVQAEVPSPTEVHLAPIADECDHLAELAECDGTRNRGAALRQCAAAARDASLHQQISALVQLAGFKWERVGNKQSWKAAVGSDQPLLHWRERGTAVSAAAHHQLQQLRSERRQWLGALLRRFTLDTAAARRRAGELEFHDLLVLARSLLRHHPEVRRALHQRYRYVFLDEFQDTDPIQLELALRLCGDPDLGDDDVSALQPLPGRLCVVGDPKQSIYRFRRADIAAYLDAERRLQVTSATLSSNFRSSTAVIDWVNHTMSTLIVYTPDAQPAYAALSAERPEAPAIGSVTVLGPEPHPGRVPAEALRTAEADDVAACIVDAITEQWPVLDRTDEGPVVRPCRLGDICILLPARTSLSSLEAALARRGIPYRAENSSLVYATDEVRALLAALRAIDDPTDEAIVVAALRTALFGCSDRHLYDWRVTAGRRFRWPVRRHDDEPHLDQHPVAIALDTLADLAGRARTSTPAQLLTRLVEQRMVLELAVTQPDMRDIWRRVRFVIDQAQAWSDAGGLGLRRYLDWVRLQGEDGRYVTETVLPETDHDAVRIMTIHAAKGLEFPVTIVSGLTTAANSRRAKSVLWPPGDWRIADAADSDYQELVPVDEQMSEAERIRLWYVACTRARDHLVVSTHRAELSRGATAAQRLAAASAGAVVRHQPTHQRPLPAEYLVAAASAALPAGDESLHTASDIERWGGQREALLASAGRPRVVSATSLATQFFDDAGLAKGPVDLDLPPWQRGRYGTQIGRAVHAVLQHCDLANGSDIDRLADAQAAAEGIIGREAHIAALARSALASPTVRSAVAAQHWRELFVATTIGDTVVEGYIDLLVRDTDGRLVVVDYKTDRLPDGTDAPARLHQYAVQLAAYGVALQQLLDEPVAGGVLVMCRPDDVALDVAIADWDELCAALGDRLTR
jgi:ATP-dependent helicase/nuclease subunit A